MITYRFQIEGTAADKQTWSVDGIVDVKNQGQFMDAVNSSLRQAFETMTKGKAVYGKPGVGCNGPYTIKMLRIGILDDNRWIDYSLKN